MRRASSHRVRAAAWAALVLFAAAVARGDDGATESPGPRPPGVAATLFDVADDLRWEQVLAEPDVAQPVSLTFDERGRMWVVQYLQYPFPAGLKIVSRDDYWRAVYDKVPAAPPRHDRGRDKITIHEDSDGDGTFDRRKTFVDGLNIATAVEIGRGGVWVLNPPYLLFYRDANGDDVPDGDPEVHLEGFGLEDTHSVVNSLTWGPDGWLYAAQGSTVTAKVRVSSSSREPVASIGQNVWRYHPETRRYEIFAEGGGNAFGVEIDARGRIFSGHNGGDTRGFHYVQGGYYQKGFSKHGALSNPHAYGYFPQMPSEKLPRFTHDLAKYEADALPEAYRDGLFGVAPLQNELTFSRLIPTGSTFRTEDVSKPVKSRDPWFRPVAITLAPDGSLYVCDWYDKDVSHLKTAAGKVDDARGRIYRLRGKDAPTAKPGPDFTKLSADEVIATLSDPNRATRRLAIRVLGDRRDPSLARTIAGRLNEADGPLALELLWALHASAGDEGDWPLAALAHRDPFVRLWATRLVGDRPEASPELWSAVEALAARERNVEVRVQLAATARRAPPATAGRVIAALLEAPLDADATDPHFPLLCWWAIEAHCVRHREAFLPGVQKSLWTNRALGEQLAPRLMRRLADSGKPDDFRVCVELLAAAPDAAAKRLLADGFEKAFEGRSIAGVPDALLEALGAVDGGSLVLKLRQGREEAVEAALAVVADPRSPAKERLKYLQVFSQIKEPACVPTALALLDERDEAIQKAALATLAAYDDPRTGAAVVERYAKFSPGTQAAAQALLASRASWALAFLDAAAEKKLDAGSTSLDVRRQFARYRDERIAARVRDVWGAVSGATTAQMEAEARRLLAVIAEGRGSPYEGKKLYRASCGKCHTLFDDGGKIGPDLTPYQRDKTEQLLLNVVNPSAAIREGFEGIAIETVDGRSLAGFLVERNERLIVLRGLDGSDVVVENEDVADSAPLGKSLMPEGLLTGLDAQQVRDLFAYLRATQPLND